MKLLGEPMSIHGHAAGEENQNMNGQDSEMVG